MKFTKIQRTRAVRMLRTARRLIKNRNHIYICYALEQATRDGTILDAFIYRRMITYIDYALEECATLTVWLSEKYGLRTIDTDIYRQIRLRWIDYMIEQLKTTGKL